MLGVALLVLFLAFIKDIRSLQPYTYLLGLLGLVFIGIPALLPSSISGVAGTGAKIQVSIAGFSFQPEEFGKLLLAASFASYLVVNGKQMSLLTEKWWIFSLPRRRDLAPILVVWAVSMLLLVFESDIGTSAVFMGMFVAMLYIATGRRSWAVIGFLLFVAGGSLAGRRDPARAGAVRHLAARLQQRERLQTTPTSSCRACTGWATAACSAAGSATASPTGPRWCRATWSSPRSARNSGLAGVMALLLLYGLFVQRGLRTALLVKDDYSKLLASGLSFMFALQVFVIVGGVTRLIPLTGITTPFLSQGGSSLVASWLLVAVLARLSDAARRPAPKPIQDEGMTQVVSLR